MEHKYYEKVYFNFLENVLENPIASKKNYVILVPFSSFYLNENLKIVI